MEAIKERETLNKLAVKYEVSPVMISRWKKEFIEREKDRYLRVIGVLQMQLDLPFGFNRRRSA